MTDSVSAPPGPGERLMLDPAVLVEHLAESHVVLYHARTHARRRIAHAAYDLLRRFLEPIAVDDVISSLGDRADSARAFVAALEQSGFLSPPITGFEDCWRGGASVPAHALGTGRTTTSQAT
jgi:hypothetical protein